MLPSRSTLRGWDPGSLTTSAGAIDSGADSIADAVKGIDTACNRMPETRAWAGPSHDAAWAIFGRANRDAPTFFDDADAIASVLRTGGGAIGAVRTVLLDTADQIDHGPLNVTDQWIVLIDPLRMSAEGLEHLAQAEQATINGTLTAVGDADDAVADGVAAAGAQVRFRRGGPCGIIATGLMRTASLAVSQSLFFVPSQNVLSR
jgi:hypothetical protein